jgi:hypothetical protein
MERYTWSHRHEVHAVNDAAAFNILRDLVWFCITELFFSSPETL